MQRNARSIQITINATHKWSVWAIDMSAVIREKHASPFHSLKGVQMCSSMMVRGIYTSDIKYSLEVNPRFPDTEIIYLFGSENVSTCFSLLECRYYHCCGPGWEANW